MIVHSAAHAAAEGVANDAQRPRQDVAPSAQVLVIERGFGARGVSAGGHAPHLVIAALPRPRGQRTEARITSAWRISGASIIWPSTSTASLSSALSSWTASSTRRAQATW